MIEQITYLLFLRQLDDILCDPVCGTAGFLVAADGRSLDDKRLIKDIACAPAWVGKHLREIAQGEA